MFSRNLDDVEKNGVLIEWISGTSRRLIVQKDGMGYGVCHTAVRARTESLLQYSNHLEARYCIAGEGEVEDMQGNVYPTRPGTIYVLNKHDRHYLRGGKNEDLVLVSVFNPPLQGHERHSLSGSKASAY